MTPRGEEGEWVREAQHSEKLREEQTDAHHLGRIGESLFRGDLRFLQGLSSSSGRERGGPPLTNQPTNHHRRPIALRNRARGRSPRRRAQGRCDENARGPLDSAAPPTFRAKIPEKCQTEDDRGRPRAWGGGEECGTNKRDETRGLEGGRGGGRGNGKAGSGCSRRRTRTRTREGGRRADGQAANGRRRRSGGPGLDPAEGHSRRRAAATGRRRARLPLAT